MGSENSKSNTTKQDSVPEPKDDGLKFGPKEGSRSNAPRSTSYSYEQHQLVESSMNANLQQMTQNVPPPAYSVVDSRHSYAPGPQINLSQNVQGKPPVPVRRTMPPTPSQVVSGPKQQNTSASNIRAASHETVPSKSNNPFYWTPSQTNNNQNDPKIQQQTMNAPFLINPKPSAVNKSPPIVPAHSPPYNPTSNPYVWSRTNSSCKEIDLEQELPKIKKDTSSNNNNNNEAASVLNKELTKNKSLAEIRKILVNNEYLSDIRIVSNQKNYFGHKLFLVTASPLFYQHFQVDGNKEMKIDGISEEDLLVMLNFCYTGSLQKLTEENVLNILVVADKLKISQAYSSCCTFIMSKINAESVFVIFEKAIGMNNEHFQKKCLEFIKKNEEKCFKSTGFFNISLPSLITILGKCDYLTDKTNEIIEKWNHGPICMEVKTPSVIDKSADNKVTNTKKKVYTANKNVQQPQSSKNPKNNENQKPKNKQKQPNQKTPSNQYIPSLIDFVIPPPPFAVGFQSSSVTGIRHIDSVSNLSDDLISFDGTDDGSRYKSHDDLVCVDDDEDGKVRVNIKGIESISMTEFSRIDFVAKRSFLLHEIWFNTNMMENCNEVKISVSVFEGDKRSDIHNRTVKNRSDKKLNFIKFTRQPLKIFIGQKFFMKVNFSTPTARKHLDPQNLSSTDFLELRRDDEVRKYFNCISKLVVSEMN